MALGMRTVVTTLEHGSYTLGSHRRLHVSQPDPFAHTGLNSTVSLTPRTNGTCPQGYQTQPTPPFTYPLDTPAQFSAQRRHHPSPSPIASGLQLTWRESDHDTIDPALRPLPHSADLDLTDPVVIAKANGYTAASKTAGAHQKAHTTKGKGKGNSQPIKCAREITADDDGNIRVKCGCPSGSNNYTTADINALLDLVEREKPLLRLGWYLLATAQTERVSSTVEDVLGLAQG
ncbi:uncharacterized protein EDB93DRAFT_1252687 [Suillus bovinus]|uniref:uncharacterized protein n=1 Tax=Suillus bovinus TaxID=48563 RepID=UPI001B883DFE|nr:uncharacterized protein EDB93DRAFT_1252687 [Suillus bovinus]KAG2140905.1 hypothetical protein EDB93DRAFT_1252687 [Suillus bovinus]